MNERIRQLAEQAREYVADAIELGFPQDQVDDIRDEKFAELIVRECANIATNPYLNDEESYYGNEFAKAIKKRFGVSE